MANDFPLRNRLKEVVQAFDSSSILVIGDIMLDQFVWGEVSRISPEAPVPVVNVQDETFLLGGAANVANNLRSLGAGAYLSGIIGDDSHGRVLLDLAVKNHIGTEGIIQARRPTTLKTRIVARGQQVVRVDREERKQPSPDSMKALLSAISKILTGCRCVIISDYDKGVISRPLMEFLAEEASVRNVPLLADPKPSNYILYRGVTIVTPNEKEAREMTGIRLDEAGNLAKAAAKIAENLSAKGVLITRGPRGMALWQEDRGLFSIPTMAREVFDVTGAGDTVISVLALGLAGGLKMCEAAYLANIAAGIVVGKVGTAAVSREELLSAIDRAPDIKLTASAG
ncbi:MAG: D-glycero-beta-D-manno-heptose-7-phosphate kinase [Thermodesulfatator sp.]|nr:MAG: D-glycero-beta-D-manno-heptose-7-phosphate kinase [Thermodesulfatator sp.]